MFTLLRWIYSLVLTLTLPVIFLRLLWRSLVIPAYRKRWLERVGIFKPLPIRPGGLWLHAVSVGEVVAAIPLIRSLQAKYPALSLTVTTTTPTGSQRLRQNLGTDLPHVYMPYDLSFALQGFLNRVQPSCLIIMETEMWPNLLHLCNANKIPVIIANGRLSDRSFVGYQRIKNFVSKMLQQVTIVAAQSQQDADRFVQLGLAAGKVHATGNLKFDVAIPNLQQAVGELRTTLHGRFVWVAASTHPGEEEQILTTFELIKQQVAQCLLILVPRHPSRFDEVAKLLEKNRLAFVRRSQGAACTNNTAVLLGDTMGELNLFYSVADVAFVGGSLVNIGGHNLLEPAALGVATITGPYTTNFKEITDKLLSAQAVCIVQDAHQLAAKIIEWFSQPDLRNLVGKNGLAVIEKNRGATQKFMALMPMVLDSI